MTWRQAIDEATRQLETVGVDDAKLNAEYLAAHALGLKHRSAVRSRLQVTVTTEQSARFTELLARRANREPLQYILGEWEFFGLPMIVRPGVLIPRPDTEVLVEEALREALQISGDISILDLGSGSGAISLALAHRLPNAQVQGMDVSAEALAIAVENRVNLGLTNVAFRKADIFSNELLADFPNSVDLLVSNPPYVSIEEFETLDPELRVHEPRLALTDESSGLTYYERIASIAPRLLSSRGRLLIELGFGLAPKVTTITEVHGLKVMRIVNDLAGITRVLVASAAK